MVLQVDELIRQSVVGSFDSLMGQLISTAKASDSTRTGSPVWEISDTIGFKKAGEAFWGACLHLLPGKFGKVYENTKPFAIRDLTVTEG